jgi:Ion transport protein
MAISFYFVFECLLKSIGRGFIFNGQYSYLRDGWSQLDFIVVIMSLLSFYNYESIKATKILRNLRVIRPLRMITKNKGLKIAVESLANSIKGIVNITIFTLFTYFVFGIIGVNFFKGLFFYCFTDHLGNQIPNIDTKWDCISIGGEWILR